MGCLFSIFCCDCTCFEPNDDWNIESEAHEGERGAGFFYKKAKGSDLVWSKRYFVVTNEKLMYFLERDRLVMKGEIIIAGATAVTSTTRSDSKKCFYFNISHPLCGTREFYCKTRNRRNQWIAKINDISAELAQKTITGKLLKQGGLSKNIWQERWCICTGSTIDYFEQATDNQKKGSLNVIGATIRPITVKDKYCFELSTAQPGKKGNKKYVFAGENEYDRDRWVEKLKNAATGALLQATHPESNNPLQTSNHMSSSGGGDDDDDVPDHSPAMQTINSFDRGSVMASELSGYLMKKSPAVMKGWQKRFFKTLPNGDIIYYKSEEEAADKNAEAKGMIKIKDVVTPNGVDLNEKSYEFTIQLYSKKVQLKAKDLDEAVEWVRNIQAWVESTRNGTSID